MKRHAIKRLKLATETLQTLLPVELVAVAGGLGGASASPIGLRFNSCNSCPCVDLTRGCPD
jgi:hypothetical protein